MISAFGVDHGDEVAKGLSPKNMKALERVMYGQGAGKAPYALRRIDYASMKYDLRNAGRGANRGPGSSVQHLKGQLKYLSGNPYAYDKESKAVSHLRMKKKNIPWNKRPSGGSPRGTLP